MGRPPKPAIDRFNRFLAASSSGCIEWTGRIDKYGYGQFRPGGRESSKVGAHRWSYEHHVGPVPPGLQLDHLCRNKKCVNHQHLEPVSPRENVLRSNNPASMNARKTHCVEGHPLSGDNIYTYGSRRVCKTCSKETSARNYKRRRAA